MPSTITAALAAALATLALLLSAATDVVTSDPRFGWLGVSILAVLSAFSLWRAGSVRAWKSTAEAREARIDDLQRELAEMRSELAIPERMEGIIRLMSETSDRQEAAAQRRLEEALARVDDRWQRHDDAAERRNAAVIEAFNLTRRNA